MCTEPECFYLHRDEIACAVEDKLARYFHNDLQTIRGYRESSAISVEDALDLLISSKGVCCICKNLLYMHDWNPMDPRQFSFDRLDDTAPHRKDNLQVTCLLCNVSKATTQYGIDRRHMPEYDEYKRIFWRLKKDKVAQDADWYPGYMSAVAAYLSHLHSKVFSNRANPWGGPSSTPPLAPSLYSNGSDDDLPNDDHVNYMLWAEHLGSTRWII